MPLPHGYVSRGAEATRSTLQNEDATPRGRMTPVTTAVAPAIPVPRLGSRIREPTCRRNLAAVAVVTATWNAPGGPWATARPGREPATSVALRASVLRYSSSSWGGARALSGGCPDTENMLEPAARPDHCVAGGASGRPSRCNPMDSWRWMDASCGALRWLSSWPLMLASASTVVCADDMEWKLRCSTRVR